MSQDEGTKAYFEGLEARLAALEANQLNDKQIEFFRQLDPRLTSLEETRLTHDQLQSLHAFSESVSSLTSQVGDLAARVGMLTTTTEQLLPAFAENVTDKIKKGIADETYDKLNTLINDDFRRFRKEFDQFRADATAMFASRQDILAAAHTPRAQTTSQKIKIQEPARFSGKREECSSFLAQLRLYFLRLKDDFTTDDSKISCALSLLEGPPLKYMEPLIAEMTDEPNPLSRSPSLQSFEKFAHDLTNNFGQLNANASNEANLRNLRQTGSATAYTCQSSTHSDRYKVT